MPPLQKVTRGDALNAIPASTWNQVFEAARKVRREQYGDNLGGSLVYDLNAACLIAISNDTGEDLFAYDTVTSTLPIPLPSLADLDTTTSFLAFPTLSAELTQIPLDMPLIVVEAIPDGEVGRAAISGMTLASVLMVDTSHQYAICTNDETYLTSAPCGPVRLLYASPPYTPPPVSPPSPPTPPLAVAVVLLGAGCDGVWGAVTGASTTLTTAKATLTIGTSPGPITGYTITNAGVGYTSAPSVTIFGDGSGASATSSVSGGGVVTLTITGGTGYTNAIAVIDPPPVPSSILYSWQPKKLSSTWANLGPAESLNAYAVPLPDSGELPRITTDGSTWAWFRPSRTKAATYEFQVVWNNDKTIILNSISCISGSIVNTPGVYGIVNGAIVQLY